MLSQTVKSVLWRVFWSVTVVGALWILLAGIWDVIDIGYDLESKINDTLWLLWGGALVSLIADGVLSRLHGKKKNNADTL